MNYPIGRLCTVVPIACPQLHLLVLLRFYGQHSCFCCMSIFAFHVTCAFLLLRNRPIISLGHREVAKSFLREAQLF